MPGWRRLLWMGAVLGALMVTLCWSYGPNSLTPIALAPLDASPACLGITIEAADWPVDGGAVGPDIDTNKAMAFLFTGYDSEERVAIWCPAEELAVQNVFRLSGGKRKVHSAAVFSEKYREAGLECFIVVVQTAAPFENCNACKVLLGIALFELRNGLWRLQRFDPAITRAGRYGRAPDDMGLVRIGPNLHGVAVQEKSMAQGYSTEAFVLLGPVGKRWAALVSLPRIGADNQGNCAAVHDASNDSGLQACWRYESEIRFVHGANESHFDIQVLTAGTESGGDGTATSLQHSEAYGFNGCRYVKGKSVAVSDDKLYFIQVAAYESFASARALEERLYENQFLVYCAGYKAEDGKTVFRVRIGDYSTRQEADRVATALKHLGLAGLVMRR